MQNEEKNYKYALILGLEIGVFMTSVEYFQGLGSKGPMVYVASVVGFPILALLGLVITRFLFSRVPVLWQFTKFGLIGVSNTALNFGVIDILSSWFNATSGGRIFVAEAIAFCFALVNSYFWNARWSFANHNPRTVKEFTTFGIITLIGLFISSGTVYLVTTYVHHAGISDKTWVNVATLIATLVTMFWNFSGYKFIVFRGAEKPEIA